MCGYCYCVNLRWLCGNFADPQYELSWREQFALSKRAHQKHLPTWKWTLWTATVIVLPFLLVMKFVYDPLMTNAGFGSTRLAFWLGWLLAVLLVFWPYSAWMYRSLYIKPLRMAMREAGWDLCINCGYELINLPANITKCPECGAARIA